MPREKIRPYGSHDSVVKLAPELACTSEERDVEPPAARRQPVWYEGQEIYNYTMAERALHSDFGIRDQDTALPNLVSHRHEYFQVHVNFSGTTTHYLGASVRPITPGTISFVLPYRVHYIPTIAGARYCLINVSQTYLLPGLDVDPLDLEDVSIERAPELAPFRYQEYMDFVLEGEDLATVARLCQTMAEENAQRGLGSTVLIRACLLQCIGLVCRRFGHQLWHLAEERVTTVARRETLISLTQFIRANFDKHILLSDAAAAVSLSPTYLAHLIKKETGRTFVELVTQRRLERAKELIAHTSLPVAKVAEMAGFSDFAYFARRFRQVTGLSPSRFRASSR